MPCALVRNSTKLESHVDLAGATVVGSIKKFNRAHKYCVMSHICKTHKFFLAMYA